MADNLLSDLLAIAEQDLAETKTKTLKEVDLFGKEEQATDATESVVHRGDTDSSEDELNRYGDYSEYRDEINNLLASSSSTPTSTKEEDEKASTWKQNTKKQTTAGCTKTAAESSDLLGIRIVKPLVSSAVLQERMVGRRVVPMSEIKRFVICDCLL